MRTIISVLLVSIIAGAFAISTYPTSTNFKNADKDFIEKQTKLFELLQHPYQPGVSLFKPEYLNIVNSFDIEKNYDLFSNVEAVKEAVYYSKKGLLPFNELFTIFNKNHRQEAIHLFNVFYYAKDWDTFYKTVLWARYNTNPGLFVYALHLAIVHRPDFAGYELPAIYEIFPHYFFSYDVMQRAQMHKQRGFYGAKKVDGVYNIVLNANYSDYKVYGYDEQVISYFTEDIGLNAFYYYYQIDYPFWMGGKEYGLKKDRRGELNLYLHQQLLARYYMERLSHDLGHIKDFTWWTPVQSYYPNIRTYYGHPFMSRDDKYVVYQEHQYYDVDFIFAYEQRLLDAIDSGYFLLENGTYYYFGNPEGYELLGNLLESNPDSMNRKYYKYLEYVFYNYQQTDVFPEVMSLPETMLRDPLMWSFMKRVFMFAYKFSENNLKPYTKEKIGFDGVKIESVDTEKLITYFDYFDADISNAVDVEYYKPDGMSELRRYGRLSYYNDEDYLIKARQRRLNHVPFKVNINVVSETSIPAVVRIYLGPKYNEYGHLLTLAENRYNYMLMDVFKYELNSGNNLITRTSTEFLYAIKDRTTYYELYKDLMQSYAGQKQWKINNYENHSGFPQRLLLPMGKKGGQTYQLFVHISPYKAPQVPQYSTFDPIVSTGIGSGSRYIDSSPLYYPLDRPIDEYQWYTPNMYYYDVNIYHKTEI